jgi:hypothetical protein
MAHRFDARAIQPASRRRSSDHHHSEPAIFIDPLETCKLGRSVIDSPLRLR